MMVDTCNENGKSLVRIYNNLDQATEIAELFRIAEPPVSVELYDSKTDEILPL